MNAHPIPHYPHKLSTGRAMFSGCKPHKRLALQTLCALVALTLGAGCMGSDDVQSSETWGIDDANNPKMMTPPPTEQPTISPAKLPGGLNADDPNLNGDCGVALCPTPWEDQLKEAASCREVSKVDTGDGLTLLSDRLKIYNEQGWLVEVREGDVVIMSNDYDERGLLLSTKTFSPTGDQGSEVRYVYNDDGLLISSTTTEGGELTRQEAWTYDELGRVSSRQDVLSEDQWTFYRYEGYVAKTYWDSNENGRLDVGIDTLFTDYTYDVMGTLLTVQSYPRAYGGPNLVMEHHYNELGKLASIVSKNTEDGSSEVFQDFSYDSMGRLLSIKDTPSAVVSVEGKEVLVKDRLKLSRTNGALKRVDFYGSFKESPLFTLELDGSMCERSLRDWRRFLKFALSTSCGNTPCVQR